MNKISDFFFLVANRNPCSNVDRDHIRWGFTPIICYMHLHLLSTLFIQEICVNVFIKWSCEEFSRQVQKHELLASFTNKLKPCFLTDLGLSCLICTSVQVSFHTCQTKPTFQGKSTLVKINHVEERVQPNLVWTWQSWFGHVWVSFQLVVLINYLP